MSSDWKQGLCGCCDDIETCFCGACCPLCQTYQNAESMGKSGFLYCLLHCIFPCLPIFLLRSEARDKYGIEGSSTDDALASFCCGACVSCQTATETKVRGDRS